MRVRFPRFSRLANPGQPLANTALSAQTAVANPSREILFPENTIFRYSVTGVFPSPGVNLRSAWGQKAGWDGYLSATTPADAMATRRVPKAPGGGGLYAHRCSLT